MRLCACARKYGEVALVALSSGRGQGRIRPHHVVVIASLCRRRVGRRGCIVIVVEREREREHRHSRIVERARARHCQAEAEGEGDRESTALSLLSLLECESKGTSLLSVTERARACHRFHVVVRERVRVMLVACCHCCREGGGEGAMSSSLERG